MLDQSKDGDIHYGVQILDYMGPGWYTRYGWFRDEVPGEKETGLERAQRCRQALLSDGETEVRIVRRECAVGVVAP